MTLPLSLVRCGKRYGRDKLSLLTRLFDLETRLVFEKEHLSYPSIKKFEGVDGRITRIRNEIIDVRAGLDPALNELNSMASCTQ